MSVAVVISETHLHETCGFGQGGKCCRYLVMGEKGFQCAKLTSTALTIDARVAAGAFAAQGDNCPGIPMETSA